MASPPIDGAKRATCWSITINNPTPDDYKATTNSMGWKDFISFEGQNEKGENGTLHIQGMLRTKSTKFSAVKKHFPRAHIEIAKSPTALEKYVAKSDTRVSEIPKTKCATVNNLNAAILELWPISKYRYHLQTLLCAMREEYGLDNTGLHLLDSITTMLMDQGYYGVEYISANPSVRSTWKKFWEHIVRREYAQTIQANPSETQSTEGQTQIQSTQDDSSDGDSLY